MLRRWPLSRRPQPPPDQDPQHCHTDEPPADGPSGPDDGLSDVKARPCDPSLVLYRGLDHTITASLRLGLSGDVYNISQTSKAEKESQSRLFCYIFLLVIDKMSIFDRLSFIVYHSHASERARSYRQRGSTLWKQIVSPV